VSTINVPCGKNSQLPLLHLTPMPTYMLRLSKGRSCAVEHNSQWVYYLSSISICWHMQQKQKA